MGQKRPLDWRSAKKVLLKSGDEDWRSNEGWEFSASGWLVERLRRAYLRRQGPNRRAVWIGVVGRSVTPTWLLPPPFRVRGWRFRFPRVRGF